MLSKGDKVAVLDDAINGVVISVKNDQVLIETEDGFEMTFFVKELVKLHNTSNLMDSIKSVNRDKLSVEKEASSKRNFQPVKKEKGEIPPPEFDLHIEKLVKSKKGMSNHDILTLQIETAQRHIEFAIKNRIPKIVFIHGVGEGILKEELDYMLGRYNGIDFQDANYQKYGLGATAVVIRQNAERDF